MSMTRRPVNKRHSRQNFNNRHQKTHRVNMVQARRGGIRL